MIFCIIKTASTAGVSGQPVFIPSPDRFLCLHDEFREARPLVHLSGELQVDRVADDHLGRGEHLQVPHHVTSDRPALGVRQADVEVGVPVQSADQWDDLELPAEVEQLREGRKLTYVTQYFE